MDISTYGLATVDASFEDIGEDLAAASVMGTEGDVKVTWDPKKDKDVEAARVMFDDLRSKQYLAFHMKGRKGTQGEQMTEFDPKAGRLLFVPPFVGG